MLREEPAALGHHGEAALHDQVRRHRAQVFPVPADAARRAAARARPRRPAACSCPRRWGRAARRSRRAAPRASRRRARGRRRRPPRGPRSQACASQACDRAAARPPGRRPRRAGSAATTAGGPSAIFSPALSTMIRRARSISAHTMCSTISTVRPVGDQAPDQGHRGRRLGRIEPGHELVEQQELGPGGQRAGQLEALAVHQGQRGRPACRPGPRGRPARAAAPPPRGRRRAAALAAVEAADPHVVERGEAGEGPDELEGAGDAARAEPVRRQPGDVAALEPDAPAIGAQGARDQVEERGLAGAVRPHDAEQLAGLEREADVVDREDAAEALGQPLDLEEGHAARRPTASALSAWRTAARGRRAARSRPPSATPAPACR